MNDADIYADGLEAASRRITAYERHRAATGNAACACQSVIGCRPVCTDCGRAFASSSDWDAFCDAVAYGDFDEADKIA
ncbi:MAG TPA: hypothetical protein VF288_10755 [Mycobacteriales bacterium]